jgi:MOSC domain-containing protein YiiM
MPASVVALFVCTASRAPLERRKSLELIEESGAQGDRHMKRGSRRQVLLMEQEVLDALKLAPGEVREQVTVRGLDLNALVFGVRLKCGTALLEVAGPCRPCERMEEIRPGLERELEGRRGRFVRVVRAGTIAVGDEIVVESVSAV